MCGPGRGYVMSDISAIAMMFPAWSRRRRLGRGMAAIVLIVAVTAIVQAASLISPHTSRDVMTIPGPPGDRVIPGSAQFSYGFDFAQEGPYPGAQSDAGAVASSRRVLSSIPGMYEDTAIMDWGLPDPEPTPGRFDFSAIASRIRLITSTGGTPVVTL